MGMILDRQTVSALTLPEGKSTAFFWDSQLKGFGLKVRCEADGAIRKSFVVQYRANGGQRRRKLGDAAKLGADAARKKALAMLGKVAEGVDPAGEREAERKSALIFSDAVAQYLALTAREARPQTQKLHTLYLTSPKYFASLHKLPLDKITPSHVAECLDAIDLNSGKATARQTRLHLSGFFVWALKRQHCQINPTIGTETFAAGDGRERVLTNDELRDVWNACGDDDFGSIVKLLILTGCRRQEIGGLRWSEIDLKAGTITLPPERTKNGHEHKLTLPDAALDIIHSVPQRVGRDLLFGSHGVTGFTAWIVAKDALDKRLNIAEWRLHDLRRTCVTGMAELGIAPHYIEAVVNHAGGHKGGVAGIYNRATYAPQMRNALAMWADHIASIISGTENKVVTLRVS